MNPYFIEMMMDEMKIFSDINDEYVSEATTYSVLDEISSFFSRLLNDLISFGKRVKEDVKAIIQKKSVNIKLKQLKKELQEQKGEGVKTVKMVDVDEYIETFKSYEKKVVKKVNKLIDGNFKRRDKIITKSDDLESLIEQMNSDLDYILKNKVTVSINDAIRYVEENISGKSNAEKVYVDICHEVRDIQIKAEHYLKDQSLRTDSDIARKHVGFVRRIIQKITRPFAKAYQKIVFTIVAFFS